MKSTGLAGPVIWTSIPLASGSLMSLTPRQPEAAVEVVGEAEAAAGLERDEAVEGAAKHPDGVNGGGVRPAKPRRAADRRRWSPRRGRRSSASAAEPRSGATCVAA